MYMKDTNMHVVTMHSSTSVHRQSWRMAIQRVQPLFKSHWDLLGTMSLLSWVLLSSVSEICSNVLLVASGATTATADSDLT